MAKKQEQDIVIPSGRRPTNIGIPKKTSNTLVPTLKTLEDQVTAIVTELQSLSEMSQSVLHNIVEFVRCLVKPGTDIIDELIFTSQMIKQFDITDKIMHGRIYSVFRSQLYMSTLDFCKCICVMCSNDTELLAIYAFQVYDLNSDGYISKMELFQLLSPCVLTSLDSDHNESVNDLVSHVMGVADFDKNGYITMDEYLALMKQEPLMIQLLGVCLPSRQIVDGFLGRLTGLTPIEVKRKYRDERQKCLMEKDTNPLRTYYPIDLDIP